MHTNRGSQEESCESERPARAATAERCPPTGVVACWNLQCTGAPSVERLLQHMARWGLLLALLQEVLMPTSAVVPAMRFGAYSLLLTAEQGEHRKPAGVLIPAGAATRAIHRAPGMILVSFELVPDVVITAVSVHAPATRCMLALEAYLDRLEHMLLGAQGMLVIGGDFQCNTDPCAMDPDIRSQVWRSWLAGRGLHHAPLREDGPTWVSTTGERSGIKDGLWASRGLLRSGTLAEKVWLHDSRSDHAVLYVQVQVGGPRRPMHGNPRTPPRWPDVRPEEQAYFIHQVGQLQMTSLSEWETMVADIARGLRPRRKQRLRDSPGVSSAREQIRTAVDRTEWSRARRRLWRILRDEKRQRAQIRRRMEAQRGPRHTHKRRVHCLELVGTEGERTQVTDTNLWHGLLHHQLCVSFGGGACDEEQAIWMALATLQTRAALAAGTVQPISIEPQHVRAALASVSDHKAPGPNGLGYGHFKHLGPHVVTSLADRFTQHANAEPPSTIPAWKEVIFTYIPKSRSRILAEMRALAITDSLQKVYLKSLLAAIADTCPIQYPPWQYGFVPGKQCADMLFLLQMLVLRASEWGVPIYICKLDISQAFDNISYRRVWSALIEAGLPMPYAAALVREIMGCKGYAKVGHVHTMEPVQITRGGRQGSPETPLVWNVVLQHLFTPMLQRWALQQWDVDLERWMHNMGRQTLNPSAAFPAPTALAAWADDLMVVAHDLDTLQRQIDDVRATLEVDEMRIKASKVEVLAGKWGSGGTVRVGDTFVHTQPAMKCLGAIIREDGSGTSHCEHSITQAVATFRAKAAYFRNRHVALQERMRHWMATVAQVALWAWEVFPPSSTSAQRMDSLQIRHLVYMMGGRIPSTDASATWQARFRKARRHLDNWRIPQLSQIIWRKYYTWAGHVARQQSMSWYVSRWRDDQWWWVHCSTTSDSLRERRASAGHQIRWSRLLVDTLGVEWFIKALDREEWKAQMPQWIEKITRVRQSGFLVGIGM